MPDSLRSLLVILVLATAVFAFAGRPAVELGMARADFLRRKRLWLGVTVAVFLAHDYWIYIALAAILLAYFGRGESNPIALYFFVLFAVPLIPKELGGIGFINHLFAVDYARLLALIVLLPAFNRLRKEPGCAPPGSLGTDKLVLGYIAIQFLLILHGDSFTNALRIGVFYPFLGIFLPYFVASRSLRSGEGFREAMVAYVVAAMVLSAIAIFEYMKHWALYTPLELSLGADWLVNKHLVRAGDLRAMASTGQPIALGFAISVAIGFLLYLRPFASSRARWMLGMGLLLVGLIASLSRGPWLGAAMILLLMTLTGAKPMKNLMKAAAAGLALLLMLLALPVGERLQANLPWIGNIDQGTIDYRGMLLDKAAILIMKNPLLGSRNFLAESSEMQDMAIGSGFIDVVNTYVRIALSFGLTGLVFFSGCFLVVILAILTEMRRCPSKDDDGYRLGQALLSVLVSIAFMIATVSSITIIPWVYWSVIGLGAGYVLMMRRLRQQAALAVDGNGTIASPDAR